jgi:hypothetical protein
MLPLSAENRASAGAAAGDEVEVEIELDSAPRDQARSPFGGACAIPFSPSVW